MDFFRFALTPIRFIVVLIAIMCLAFTSTVFLLPMMLILNIGQKVEDTLNDWFEVVSYLYKWLISLW